MQSPKSWIFSLLDENAICVPKFSRYRIEGRPKRTVRRDGAFSPDDRPGGSGGPGPVRRRRGILCTGAADRVADPFRREAPGIDFFVVIGKKVPEAFNTPPSGRDPMPIFEMEQKPELEAGVAHGNPSVLSIFAPVEKSVHLLVGPMVPLRHDAGLVRRPEALPGHEPLDPPYHLERGGVSPQGETPEPDRGIRTLKKSEIGGFGSRPFDGDEKKCPVGAEPALSRETPSAGSRQGSSSPFPESSEGTGIRGSEKRGIPPKRPSR